MDSNAVEIAEDLEQFVKTIADTEPLKKVSHRPGVFAYEFKFHSPKVNNGKVVVVSKTNITIMFDNEICYSSDFFDARRYLAIMS